MKSVYYTAVMSIKWPQFHKWLVTEVEIRKRINLDQLFQWDKVLADLKQNKSLEYVELGILQNLDRFASHMAHHEDSEISDEDGDSESSNEDRDCLDEDEFSDSSDEDEDVDLYKKLQELKARG
jgi:hypothetical protein